MAHDFTELSSQPHAEVVSDATPTKNQVDLAGTTILVVDDEPDASRLISLVLGVAGATVQVAHSKEQALQLVAQTSFDAVVSDLSMPGGDGLLLLEEMRKQGYQMPAVALSALPWIDVQGRVRQAGFALHLEKPVGLSMLTAALADLIEAGRGS